MAPSPELGQPKAPDKTDTTTTGTAAGGKSEDKTDSGDKYESIKETEFSSTTTTTTTTTSNMTTTNTTKQQDSENLSNLDERALEALLKEAITYKTPRDREHKSEMFRELLQDAEKENQKSDFSSYDLRYRKHKGSSRHTQGGSLQDLAETDNLDDIFGHNKKHYNLKQRHSSVSSRQREGGSLPSNVNVSFHNLMSFDTSCMFDVNLKKKCKNSGMHSMKQQQQQQLNSKDESQLYESKIVGDTVIEIGDDESDDNQTNIPYEPLQEELSDPINPDVDYTDVNSSLCQKLPRIQPQRQYTSQAKIEISETSPPRLINQSNADKTVSFSLLENNNNKNNVDMIPVQLNPSYNSVESIVGNKSTELNPRPSTNKFISANIFPQKLDVGDTSVQPFNASLPTSSQPNKSKNKKVPKSDRNTITVDYTKKEGFRGNDTINDLVRYIEAENETEKRRKENSYNNNNGNSNNNNNNSNSNNPSNNNHNNNGAVLNSNSSNKKSKNNNNNSKKDSSKLKKCNSLEELSSCSKLKELKDSSSNSHTSSSSSSASSSSASSTTSQNQMPTEAVTLRTKTNATKSKQNSDPNANIVISNSTTTTTGNNNSNNKKLVLIKKRSERRSWGTEELSYLGDSKVNSDYIKNNEILKNNSDDVNNNDDESLVICSGSYNINSLESNELISSQVNSMDASEFLLVTKKKKPKKIKLENNNNNNMNNNNKNSGNNNNNRGTNNRSKYNYNNSHMTHNTVTNQNNHHPHHNDRDIYLNSFNSADNNRRKSTSSVPPSERSDSSDLDSVHSLPVESIKSIQMSNKTTVSPPAATKQSSNQISYADIAKIPNKQNINVSSNNIDIPNNNNSDNINTALSVTATDNSLNKQLLYSKSLNEIKTLPNQLTAQPQQPNGIIMSQIQNKTQFLLKSKSVDNDNYNVSIDQYPALEKTVKKSSNTNSMYVCNPIIDNRMNKTSKKLPAPQNFVTTTISTPKKILIEPIEVSQIEQSIVDELYNKPVLNNKPATLKQVVVNNNNNANINKLNEFTVAPVVEILPVVVTPGPVLPIASISSSTSSTSTTSKRLRKDKSNPNSVALKNNINSNSSSSSSSSNRPAVIILNDMDRDKPSNDITFGFEINQKLLFGDFNEDDMKLFETGTPQTTTTTITTNNSDVSDYFSISDTSLELSSTTTMTNHTPVSVSNPSNNNNKLQDTDNQCDIINSVEQVVDKLNNNNLENNNSLDKNENFMKICETDITKINFKAPNLNDIILTEHNHDKIVNFIESAWEDIVSGTNGGAQYYNGQ